LSEFNSASGAAQLYLRAVWKLGHTGALQMLHFALKDVLLLCLYSLAQRRNLGLETGLLNARLNNFEQKVFALVALHKFQELDFGLNHLSVILQLRRVL